MGWTRWTLGKGLGLGLFGDCGTPGDDSSADTLDDGCTGAACCEGGCPSSNPETGLDMGDEGDESAQTGGEDCGAACDETGKGDDDDGDDDDDDDDATADGDDDDDDAAETWGVCRRSCNAATDCCPAGGECPWFACEAGVCVPSPCTPGSCEPFPGGVDGGLQEALCLEVDGHPQCVGACGDQCPQPNSSLGCFGVADDGSMYCYERCDSPWWGCAPGQTCDELTGRCFCTASDQCQEGEVCDPV